MLRVLNGFTLRNATPNDSEFAYRVRKAAFREYAEKVWGWDEDEQRELHEQRFRAHDFRIINVAGTDVGIIAVAVAADCVKVNQLFLLQEHQGKDIGRKCMLLIYGRGAPVEFASAPPRPRARGSEGRAGFKRKSGVRYRLNRWREEQLAKGSRLTYRDLVKEYVRLNLTKKPFARIPHGRCINFVSDFLAAEKGTTREQAIRAWEKLKTLDVPKTYRSWVRSQV